MQRRLQNGAPLMVVIAGHNGAGKTTFYRAHLHAAIGPYIEHHINADDLEKDVEQCENGQHYSKSEREALASKEAARLRQTYLDQEVSFSFETVFSDPVGEKVAFINEARRRDYNVLLLAVGLDSVDISKQRVACRHAFGGHNLPPEKLEERYPRVLKNLAQGARVASLALFMDNSADDTDQENGMGCYQGVACFDEGLLVATAEYFPAWWTIVTQHLANEAH